jgi:hypothetical protein
MGIMLAGIPGAASAAGITFPFSPGVSGRYTPESAQDILNAVMSTRYLTGGFIFFAIKSGAFTGPALLAQQANAARTQDQIDFLASIGAQPLETVATLDPKVLSDPQLVNKATVGTIDIIVSMDVTAVRELAELGQPVLAKWMAQLLAVDAAAAEATRIGSGNAVSYAFAPEFFLYTRDALAALRGVGFFGGSGIPAPYPGRDAMLAAAGPLSASTLQQRPNDATSSLSLTSFADIDMVLGGRP